MAYMHIITELPCLHNFRQECATGLCSEFRISRHFLLRCDVLLVLETIGSEMNPIWIDDDDDDDEGGDGGIVNDDGGDGGDGDDESDDDYLYEWCPLDLRQFGMLRSFVQLLLVRSIAYFMHFV